MLTPEEVTKQSAALKIRELYPELTEHQLKEAEANLARYFAIAIEICSGQLHDGKPATVDSDCPNTKMEERSNVLLKN